MAEQVWLLIEREEDEGTDFYNVLAVYSSEVDAHCAETILEEQHGNTDGEWCECHGKDWRVEGPYKVDGGFAEYLEERQQAEAVDHERVAKVRE